MDRAGFARWLGEYERAWRAPGTAALTALFTPDVRYLPSPWTEPVEGLRALGLFWEAERDGPAEAFTADVEVVAVDGDTGVARVEVRYARGPVWRDLWVVHFAADGRARGFEEWPFAPDQPDGH